MLRIGNTVVEPLIPTAAIKLTGPFVLIICTSSPSFGNIFIVTVAAAVFLQIMICFPVVANAVSPAANSTKVNFS